MFSKQDAEQFIERLKCFYGAEFNRKWAGVAPAMLVETVQATFQGITPDQMQTCLKRIKVSSSEFCPSLPSLLALCYSEIKSEHEAYKLTSDPDINDPLVYETIHRIGSYDFKNIRDSKAKPLFVETYRQVKADYMSGQRFEIPPKVEYKERPKPPELTEEEIEANKARAKEYLDNLKKLMK